MAAVLTQMKRLAHCVVVLLICLGIGATQPPPGPMGPPPGMQPPPGGHAHEREEKPQAPRDADWAPFRVLEGRRDLLAAALRATQQQDALTRRRGLFTLGALGLPEGVSAMKANLQHPDRLVRMQAAIALAMLYRQEGLPGAAVALREGPDWSRFYALYGLWRLNSARSLQVLRASRPWLSGFLLETLDAALKAKPSLHGNTLRSGKPNLELSLYSLWDKVSSAYVVEGDLWWHRGNYDQSIRCQWTALFFDPTYVDLYTNIAWLQWSMDRHQEAIRTYKQCIAANPQDWEAYQALGNYYITHQQKELGAQFLQKAADLGSPPIPRRVLGHTYRDLGQAEKAKQVWQDILKMDPNDPIAKRELERAR